MYEHITSESIQSAILENVSAFDTQEGSFARTLIAPAAYEMWKVYTALEGVPLIGSMSQAGGLSNFSDDPAWIPRIRALYRGEEG